ncbi:hypothetical protein PARMER_02794 [Parabacteroides merdae ATCC 43184]|nr:hypothetical protein PARMER_02794 [Parabacteroides merdae ATCC 43184]
MDFFYTPRLFYGVTSRFASAFIGLAWRLYLCQCNGV